VANAGLPEQRSVAGRLADIAAQTSAAGLAPPAITVIGAVVGLDLHGG
jgi:uroporphyrin-III C-methyltransferase